MSEIMLCGRCNRKLKTTKSIANGYGPVCKKKHDTEIEQAELMDKRVDALFGQEKPYGGITNLKPSALLAGDVVRVENTFWFYDEFFEKDKVFTITPEQANNNFEKYVVKVK